MATSILSWWFEKGATNIGTLRKNKSREAAKRVKARNQRIAPWHFNVQSLCKLREVQEYRLSMLITIELFIYRGAILELINHVYVHAYINICALVKKHACIHIKEYTGTYTNLQSILMNVCVCLSCNKIPYDTIGYDTCGQVLGRKIDHAKRICDLLEKFWSLATRPCRQR